MSIKLQLVECLYYTIPKYSVTLAIMSTQLQLVEYLYYTSSQYRVAFVIMSVQLQLVEPVDEGNWRITIKYINRFSSI